MSRDDGFTLTELTAVLVVIGILAAIAVASYVSASTRASQAACWSNQRMIEKAIPVYLALHDDNPPDSIEDLEPYVATWANVRVCPADRSVTLTLDPVTLSVTCPLHPR